MSKVGAIDEELLQAYVDGELDASAAAGVERLLAQDQAAARYVAEQRALAETLRAALQPALQQKPPRRLQLAARVLGERLERQAHSVRSGRPTFAQTLRRWFSSPLATLQRTWTAGAGAAWAGAGMAASLLLGLWLGQGGGADGAGAGVLVAQDGRELLAQGALEEALSTRLAAAQGPDDPVRLGLSFVSKDGPYCRSFVLSGPGTAGLACRTGRGWALQMLARSEPQSGGGYRQAGSALPEPVLAAIDARIAGESLDAAAEQQALQQGWRRVQPRATR